MENSFKDKTPGQLAEDLMRLSHEYGDCVDQPAEIMTVKPAKWSIIRDQVTSDKQAEKQWEATEPGMIEMTMKLRMKQLEKKMSAIKTYLHVKDKEAMNQY